MPQPNGYRKALRFMKHADHFGFPIVTFVDTPGAYAGKNAEELGQVCTDCNICAACLRREMSPIHAATSMALLSGPNP